MCTETGIKDVYWGVQGACPRRAVTHAGGTAERRAVGMGLKLVLVESLSDHQMAQPSSAFLAALDAVSITLKTSTLSLSDYVVTLLKYQALRDHPQLILSITQQKS